MTRHRRFTLVLLAMALVGLVIGAHAWPGTVRGAGGGVSLTERESTTGSNARVVGPDGQLRDEDPKSEEFTGAGSFSASTSSTASYAEGGHSGRATGRGSQTSSVTVDGDGLTVDIDASFGATAEITGVPSSAQGLGQSDFDVTFTIDAPMDYTLEGTRTIPTSGEVDIRFANTDIEGNSFNESGRLEAGTYSLDIVAEARAEATTFFGLDVHNPPSSGDYHVSFRVGAEEPDCPDVEVGFATAQGCFTERENGVFETDQKAWVGGFEIQPRPGGSLVLSPGTPAVSAAGTGVDMVFAGFKVPIPVRVLPVDTAQATVQFGGGAGTVAKVLDIPVEASVKVAWTDGGRSATYEQKVAIKKLTESIGPLVTPPGSVLGDFGGELKAKLENGVGFVLERGEVRIDKVTLLPDKLKVKRKLGLRDLLLRFELKDDKPFWTGRAGITLPVGARDLGFTGTVYVFDGSLAGGGLAVDGINKQLGGTPLFLQGVSGFLLFAPRWGHDLGITGSLGPRVGGKQLLTLTGQMRGGELITGSDCPSGDDPEKLLLSSKLTPLEPLELAGLASAQMSLRACTYPFAGLVPSMDVTATIGIEFARGALAYEASQTGFVSDRGANLEGAAQLTLPIPGLSGSTVGDSSVLSGSAIVSTEGTGACATVGFFDAGFGHRWGEGAPSVFTGCDLGRFRVTASPSTADAHAAQAAIQVPAGLPHAGFAATAEGGAPRVTVSGPGGLELSSPPDGSVLRTPDALIAPVATESTTYVFVRRPQEGDWRVEAADPDNPLSNVSFARGLPDPKVNAKVRKPKDSEFKLAYKVKSLPGQKVVFTERGAGIARKLGRARGRSGSISFNPTIAASRKRRIDAEVIQDGLPRELTTIARFKAPPLPRLKGPRVRANRERASLRLAWPRVRGAAGYIAEVKAGRELLFRVLAKKRKLRFTPTPKKGALKVTVQAISKTQPPGPRAKLKLKAPRR